MIERASPEQAEEAVRMLREVSSWLVAIGRPLWRVDGFRVEVYREAARNGELVFGYRGVDPVAMMLLQARDDLHWPDDPPGEALYVHKVAVRRCAAGENWAARLLDWARAQAIASGARFLRLDTADRYELLSLYRRYGFYVVDDAPRQIDDLMVYRLELRLNAD